MDEKELKEIDADLKRIIKKLEPELDKKWDKASMLCLSMIIQDLRDSKELLSVVIYGKTKGGELKRYRAMYS